MYDMVKSSHLIAYQRAIEGINSMIKDTKKKDSMKEN
jgi:hypothetical protein